VKYRESKYVPVSGMDLMGNHPLTGENIYTMHSSCTAVISQSENKRKFENGRRKAVRRACAVWRQYDAAPRQR
jgi:hypothetical protein